MGTFTNTKTGYAFNVGSIEKQKYALGSGTLTKVRDATPSPSLNYLKNSLDTAKQEEQSAINAVNDYVSKNMGALDLQDPAILEGLRKTAEDATAKRVKLEQEYNATEGSYEQQFGNLSKFDKAAASVIAKPFLAADVAVETAKAAAKGEDINMNTLPMQKYGQMTQARQDITEGMGAVGTMLTNTGLSIADNLYSRLLLPGVPYGATVPMFVTAAADKMYDLGSQGESATRALVRGGVSGAIEGLTEALPLGTLDDLIKKGGKSVVENLLKQGRVEAAEEGVSYIANYIADKASKDPNAKWDWKEFRDSVVGGGLSGLFFGLGGTVMGNQNTQTPLTPPTRPVDAQTVVPPTTPISEQKTAPEAVNGAEAEDYYFDPSEENTSWRERMYSENGKTYIQSQDRQRMYEVPSQKEINYAVNEDGTVVLNDDVIGRLSPKDYRDFTKAYAELNLVTKFDEGLNVTSAKPVTVKSTGGNVIITQAGINDFAKKIRGTGLKNRDNVSSVLLLDKLIENSVPVSSSGNTHSESGNPFTYYKSKLKVGNTNYDVTLHIKNVPTDDRYYYHSLDKVDINETQQKNVAPTYGNSVNDATYQTEVGTTTSGDIVTPDDPVVNTSDTESVGAAPAGFDPYSNMINQYGIIPEGENPSRIVDLPKSTDGKDRVSYTARTVMEAEATPDAAVEDIGEAVLAGNLSYIPVSNKQAEAMARASIKRAGDFSTALANWTAEVRQGKTSAKLTAMGALLYNESVNSGNTKQAISILADYAAMVRHGAQAVQAARILKTLSPKNKLLFIQQTVNKMNEQFNGKGLESLADINGGINLDTTLINEYLTAKTEEARNAALDKIYQNIADQVPSTLTDKFTALRYLNMLGNLKTQARNVIGNALNVAVRDVDKHVQALVQAVVHRNDPTKKTVTFLGDSELRKLAKAEFDTYRSTVMGEQKYSATESPSKNLHKEIEDRRTIFKNNGTWGTKDAEGIRGTLPLRAVRKTTDVAFKGLEAARKATSWMMDKGDEVFGRYAYSDSLARYLKAKGYTAEQWKNNEIPVDVLDEARAHAIKEAQESTFRDSNAFSDAISKIGFKNPQNKVEEAANVAVKGTLPFKKTPANVAVQAVKHSPLGLVNVAVTAAKANNPDSDIDGNDVIKALSETLTGSGLFLLGMALRAGGHATGGEDEDKELAQLDELQGVQEYSITVDGKSYTYDWATPAAMPFAIGVVLQDALERNGGLSIAAISEAISGMTDVALNMSMLSGLNDAFENVSYSEHPLVDSFMNAAVSYLTQGLTSTLLGQVERTFEEDRMTTFRDKSSTLPTGTQYTLGKTSAKIPGWDFQQIPYIDAWGRTESNGTLPTRAFENFLSPAYSSTENTSAVDKELRRLAEKGYTGVAPDVVEQNQKVDGEYMDAKEYVDYATTKGKTSYDIVTRMIRSDFYKGLDDTEKSEAIALAYTYANHVAAKKVNPKHEFKGEASTVKKAVDAGVPVHEFIAYYSNKSDYDSDNNGSYSTAENIAAIDATGMTGKERTAMFMITFPQWIESAEKRGVDFDNYVEYKVATAGASTKADKLAALRNAGYTVAEANRIYREMEQ